jgi:hypothetical protein
MELIFAVTVEGKNTGYFLCFSSSTSQGKCWTSCRVRMPLPCLVLGSAIEYLDILRPSSGHILCAVAIRCCNLVLCS